MKRPAIAADKIPLSLSAGARVRQALEATVNQHPSWLQSLEGLLVGHRAMDVPRSAVREARSLLQEAVQATLSPYPPAGLCPQLLKAWQQAADDPDVALPE